MVFFFDFILVCKYHIYVEQLFDTTVKPDAYLMYPQWATVKIISAAINCRYLFITGQHLPRADISRWVDRLKIAVWWDFSRR